MCEDADHPCFRQETTTIEPGETLLVDGLVLVSDNHSVYPPRLEIIDPAADPLVNSDNIALDCEVVPIADGSVAVWQEVAVSYTNNGIAAKPVIIRCSAMSADGDIYEVWKTSRFQWNGLALGQ